MPSFVSNDDGAQMENLFNCHSAPKMYVCVEEKGFKRLRGT